MDTPSDPALFEALSQSLRPPGPGRYWHPLSKPTYGVDEIYRATEAMCRYETTMGSRVTEFEEAFAKAVGKRHAIMVNSGSSAALVICMMLRETGIPAGSEVLLPAVTWPTVLWAIYLAGFKPVLVDVKRQTANVDINDLNDAVTKQTKAIIVPHILGYPADMPEIYEWASRKGIAVIEDCCEAFGTKTGALHVGSRAMCSFFSMFFSHHLMTMEGGMICTNVDTIARTLHMLRSHGWDRRANPSFEGRYRFLKWGVNVRPMEVQAAFGLPQLAKAQSEVAHRKKIATDFGNAITHAVSWIDVPTMDPGMSPFGLGMYVNSSVAEAEARDKRAALCTALEDRGIETRPMIAGNMQRQPVANDPRYGSLRSRRLPGADYIDARGIYIGLHPTDTDDQVHRLIESVSDILRNC